MTRVTIQASELGRRMRTNCPDCKWDVERDPITGRVTIIHGLEPCDTCRRATLHDSNLHVTGSDWNWPEPPPTHCFRCNKDMRYPAVHGPAGAHHDEETSNECNILFTGGYGSFIDAVGGKLPLVVICHECAHELCDWLGIDPRLWHTHSVYGGQHDDHHDNHS